MLWCCWSAKGGSGATVVAAALGCLGAAQGRRVVLVDLAGDLPDVLAVAAKAGGVSDWLAAGVDTPVDGLRRLELSVRPGLSLVPAGPGPLPQDESRARALADLLAAGDRLAVVDLGTISAPNPLAEVFLASATRSILVTRACYVALRRATRLGYRVDEVVLVAEPGRSLRRQDVEMALGAPVSAVVPCDPGVMRRVDAGLLSARLPLSLQRLDRVLAA